MLQSSLIGLGAALLLGSAANAQLIGELAPSFNACAHTHGDEELYFATMAEDGWTVTEDRDAAIARLSDSFLPVLGPSGIPWDEMMQVRTENGTFNATELVGDRDIYEQSDHLIMIGGYENENGDFRLDCWLVLPDDRLNNATFTSAEDQHSLPELRMAAFSGPSHSDGSVTRIMAVQLRPSVLPNPPLAGKNGLYIQTIVPGSQSEDDGQNQTADN